MSTGRVYTLDHPEVTPLTEVAGVLDELIRGSIGSLLIPTTRRIRWGHANRVFLRAAHVEATLLTAGWSIDPHGGDDPLCDVRRVASELGMAGATTRRWMGRRDAEVRHRPRRRRGAAALGPVERSLVSSEPTR